MCGKSACTVRRGERRVTERSYPYREPMVLPWGNCRTWSDLRLNLDIAAACYFDNHTGRDARHYYKYTIQIPMARRAQGFEPPYLPPLCGAIREPMVLPWEAFSEMDFPQRSK